MDQPISTRKRVWLEALIAALGLAVVLSIFFSDVVWRGRSLVPADFIFFHDPVWRGLAPPELTGPSNPLLSDLVYQFYPWRAYTAYWLSRGELPLWNLSVLGGASLIGNDQSALFYPLNLLGYLLPLSVGFGVSAMCQLGLAGLGTFAYLRLIGRSRAAASLGGIAFALCGFLVVWLGYSLVSVAVWLPAILLLIELIFRTGRFRWTALLALVTGVQFLAGHVETSFHLAVVAAAYTLVLANRARSRVSPRLAGKRLALALAGAGLGFGLGAVQIVPFLEALAGSSLIVERAANQAGSLWFSPVVGRNLLALPTLIFPNLLGSPAEPGFWSFSFLPNFNEATTYTGTIPLVSAVVGAWSSRRDARLIFWLIAAVVSFGVAYRLPLFELINHLPLFNITANGRLRLILSFAIIVLAAAGLDRLTGRDRPDALRPAFNTSWTIRLVTTFGVLALLALLGVYLILNHFRAEILAFGRSYVEANVFGQPGFPQPLDYYQVRVEQYYAGVLSRFAPFNPRTYFPVFAAFFLAGGLWIARRGRLDRKWLGLALPAVTAVELITFGRHYNPTVDPAAIFPETPVIAFLRQQAGSDRIAGLGFALNPNSAMIWSLPDVRGYEIVRPARSWDLLRAIEGRETFGDYLILGRGDPPVLNLFSARYIVADSAVPTSTAALRPVFTDRDITVYQNDRVLPRTYLVGQARVLADPAEIRDLTRSGSFDTQGEVLLEAAQNPPVDGIRPAGQSEAKILSYRPNRIEIAARSDSAGYLVVTDTYDEGWSATVDGRPSAIYRANYAFRAVRLEPGEHTVEMVYRPRGLIFGAVLTGLSGLVILVIGLSRWFHLHFVKGEPGPG